LFTNDRVAVVADEVAVSGGDLNVRLHFTRQRLFPESRWLAIVRGSLGMPYVGGRRASSGLLVEFRSAAKQPLQPVTASLGGGGDTIAFSGSWKGTARGAQLLITWSTLDVPRLVVNL
jgi:hypothetical protein